MTVNTKRMNEIPVPKVGELFTEALHEHHIAPIAQDDIPEDDKQKIDLAQENFIDFVEYTYPKYKTEPFHRDVADTLDKVVSGEIKDNPGFSSHTNYTDFLIRKVK